MLKSAIAAVVLVAGINVVLQAQAPAVGHLTIAPEAGISIPVSRLGDLENPGPSAGVHLVYQLVPRLALDADGVYDALHGATFGAGAAPDMRLWHFTAGTEVSLLPSLKGPWSLAAGVGAGTTRFATNTLFFNHTYFSASGGLHLGYAVSRKVLLFANGQASLARLRQADTQVLVALDPAHPTTFTSGLTFPLTLGFRASL